jgi:hypothetical protein
MQKIIFSITLFVFISISSNGYFQKPHFFAPFQGKKVFCSTEHSEKVLVSITGNQVTIVIGKRKIIGNYKSTKILLTNDPEEISYRKTAGKYHYGTYYVIQNDYLSILEPENGEYAYTYELCK